ncbi:15574_t:CDS:2, partial [Gigaspora rosea]
MAPGGRNRYEWNDNVPFEYIGWAGNIKSLQKLGLCFAPETKENHGEKIKEEWILYEDKKSQELNIERIKRKMETKAKIEVWASGDKENLELEFKSEKKRRKANLEKKQIKKVTQEKKALTDIS